MWEQTPEFVRVRAARTARALDQWQRAVSDLSQALPIGSAEDLGPPLRAADFSEFMFQRARPSFTCSPDRIRWRIALFVHWDFVFGSRELPFLAAGERIRDEQDLGGGLPQLKRWLMSLRVDDYVLMNAPVHVLPFLCDADPAFVRLALDLDTWRRCRPGRRGLA